MLKVKDNYKKVISLIIIRNKIERTYIVPILLNFENVISGKLGAASDWL